MTGYLHRFITRPIPQTEPLDDRQVQNNAGGYSYPVNDAVRMHRFLIMGSEGGSFYQKERDLAKENVDATKRYIAENGLQAVAHIVDVSINRRAPRVSPILFCLALAASADDDETRKAALDALPTVASTASMLEEFTAYVDSMRGWGRGLKDGVSRWYTSRHAKEVAFQAVKYRTRNGWSHRDLLRKAHPRTRDNKDLWHVFEWITKGTLPPQGETFDLIHAYEEAKNCDNVKDLVSLINERNLPREAVPTNMLKHDDVWGALAPQMPPLAFVRNLPTLTAHNVIRPMEANWAVERINQMRSYINDKGEPVPAPVHPFHLLTASMVYRMGKSIDGNNTWSPVSQISTALDQAFHESFSATKWTNQRVYLAVDTSGSMGQTVGRIRTLTASMTAAAVAMMIARREPTHMIVACSDKMEDLHIAAHDSLISTATAAPTWPCLSFTPPRTASRWTRSFLPPMVKPGRVEYIPSGRWNTIASGWVSRPKRCSWLSLPIVIRSWTPKTREPWTWWDLTRLCLCCFTTS